MGKGIRVTVSASEPPVLVPLFAAFCDLSKGKYSTITRFIYYMLFINVCRGFLS